MQLLTLIIVSSQGRLYTGLLIQVMAVAYVNRSDRDRAVLAFGNVHQRLLVPVAKNVENSLLHNEVTKSKSMAK